MIFKIASVFKALQPTVGFLANHDTYFHVKVSASIRTQPSPIRRYR